MEVSDEGVCALGKSTVNVAKRIVARGKLKLLVMWSVLRPKGQ